MDERTWGEPNPDGRIRVTHCWRRCGGLLFNAFIVRSPRMPNGAGRASKTPPGRIRRGRDARLVMAAGRGYRRPQAALEGCWIALPSRAAFSFTRLRYLAGLLQNGDARFQAAAAATGINSPPRLPGACAVVKRRAPLSGYQEGRAPAEATETPTSDCSSATASIEDVSSPEASTTVSDDD